MVTKSLNRARAESSVERIIPLSSPSKISSTLRDHGLPRPERLGMELDVLPVNLFKRYTELFHNSEISDISTDIRMQRAVKSDYELDIISHAAHLSDQVAAHAATIIRAGMTELELAGQVEAYARKLGHQGIVRMRMWGGELFYGHLMAGPSGAVPSYMASPTGGSAVNPAVAQGAGFSLLKPYEPILLDYVFAFNGYISDHTRIFALDGLPDDLLAAHATMIELQEMLKQAAKPGIKCGHLYDMAMELTAGRGYRDYFYGLRQSTHPLHRPRRRAGVGRISGYLKSSGNGSGKGDGFWRWNRN